MSLKAFHIVFITASILLSLGSGFWGFRSFSKGHDYMELVVGIFFFVTAGTLIYYLMGVPKRLKNNG